MSYKGHKKNNYISFFLFSVDLIFYCNGLNLYVAIDNHAAIQYKSIEGDTFLHLVSKTGFFFEVAKSLLDREDIDINAKNDQGDAPLSLALKNNASENIINVSSGLG